MYSFIRNDKHSFAEHSRVYDVYNSDGEIETSLVVGYDDIINKYFVCYHAIERFYDYHNEYPADSELLWMDIMLEFIEVFENAWDITDIITDDCAYNANKIPKLKRENLYYYLSACDDYNHVDDCPRYESDNEEYIDELLVTKCLVPFMFEGNLDENDDELYQYTADEFCEYIEECERVESIYCNIDFNTIIEILYEAHMN